MIRCKRSELAKDLCVFQNVGSAVSTSAQTYCAKRPQPLLGVGSRDAREIQGDYKVSVHLMITVQKTRKIIFKNGHHRIHSECGPCYTEHRLREQSSGC
jgi:hypothetical protein